MSELMHVDVIAMLSLQVSPLRPHFHPCEWRVYQGRTIQQREETLSLWDAGAAVRA